MNFNHALIAGVLSLLLLEGCAHPPTSSLTTPTIALYGRNGHAELNCRLPLTTGKHILGGNNNCKQDFSHNFVIENPREGVTFTFFAQKDCNPAADDNGDRGNIQYKIIDPISGQPTEMTGIDQGRGLPAGTEVNPGIVLVHGSVALPPVAGRDECILVNNSN